MNSRKSNLLCDLGSTLSATAADFTPSASTTVPGNISMHTVICGLRRSTLLLLCVYIDLLSSSCVTDVPRVCFAQIPSLNISAAIGDGANRELQRSGGGGGRRGNGRSGGGGGRTRKGVGGAGEASPMGSPRESPRCARARARVRLRLHTHGSLSTCVCLFVSACMRKSPWEFV